MVSASAHVSDGESGRVVDGGFAQHQNEQRDQQIMLAVVLGWALTIGTLLGIGLWHLRGLL